MTEDIPHYEGTEGVDKDSPPCLIYQGELDGIVDPRVAASFRDAYTSIGNKRCALLSIKYATHVSGFYFSGYYNQIFMYFMERLMYLYR